MTIDPDREPAHYWSSLHKLGFSVVKNFARRKVRDAGRFRFGQVWDISPDAIRASDPSEGVRASDIIPVIRATFPDTEVFPFNGSILDYALDQTFYKNYREDTDRELFDLLTELDRAFVASGDVPSIYAYVIARKADGR